jgi:PIN domain nuclease of toxin-antitoxin system
VKHLLLDTHVVLWAFSQPDHLSPAVRRDITDPRNVVMVSAATIWEVEIKRALGKLRAPDGLHSLCVERGFDPLDISFEHAVAAGSLPAHHTDPFDRMLIAQAIVEGAQIVTADSTFDRYEVQVVPALI